MYLHEYLFAELIRQSSYEEEHNNENKRRKTHSIIDNLPLLTV